VRTVGDWNDPPPGYVEVDLVAHGGPSASGSFVRTVVLTGVATGWTERVPIVVRDGALVIEALARARALFPFPLRGVDVDNESAFMNEPVIGWCRARGLEVTRSRAYRKNDRAWVEQKNGAIVRRLVGYGRLEGLLAAEALARLSAASRQPGNLLQPSFKLREKTRKGARVIELYHVNRHRIMNAMEHHDLVAPVELVRLAGRKAQRHEGRSRRRVLPPPPPRRIPPHRVPPVAACGAGGQAPPPE